MPAANVQFVVCDVDGTLTDGVTGINDRGEEFKNFVTRVGPQSFEAVVQEFKELPELNRETLDTYMDWNKTVKYTVERGEGECAV